MATRAKKGCKRFVAICRPKSKRSGWGQIQFSFHAPSSKKAEKLVEVCLRQVNRPKERFKVEVVKVRNVVV